ncbi:unnamed protein product, partial [Ectocarpus sp. 12 AP-2014]
RHNFLTSAPISTILSSICTPDPSPCVWRPVGVSWVRRGKVRSWSGGRGRRIKYLKNSNPQKKSNLWRVLLKDNNQIKDGTSPHLETELRGLKTVFHAVM